MLFFFLFLLLSFKSSLYVLGTSPLSDVYFANILPQSMTSHFLGGVVCRAEVFNFSKFCFSVLSFMDHAFATVSKSHHHTPGHIGSLLCYVLEISFLHFIFRSIIHFELIFVKGVDLALDECFCMWMSNWSSTFVEKYDFCSVVLPLPLC